MSALPAIGELITLQIDSIAMGGDAFGRWLPRPGEGTNEEGASEEGAGIAVFADRGIPGDLVRARVSAVQARHFRVEVEEIIRPSERAVKPVCDVADICGGCRFWRASYADELTWKAGATEQSLKRLSGGVQWPRAVLAGAPAFEAYRERARLRFDAQGQLGFSRARSHEVIAPPTCQILHPALEAARPLAEALFGRLGAVESVFLEWDAVREGTAMTAELSKRDSPEVFRKVRERIQRFGAGSEITTIVLSSNGRSTTLLGDGMVHRARSAGPTTLTVREPTAGFSQTHQAMNERLVELMLRAAGPADQRKSPVALDLFSGSGNLTFPLAGLGYEVDAVEVAPRAIAAAAEAAREAQELLPRLRFHVGDLSASLPLALQDRMRRASLVVLDPPRGGIAKSLAREIARLPAVERLIYVSCDPPALARDAGRLGAAGWRPVELALLDLFPRTPHLEALAVFERG